MDSKTRVVPLFDLARSITARREDVTRAFERIISTADFTLGQDLEMFERRFAAFCGVKHCVGVSDGTSALRLGLTALGARPGTRVITVPNTFVATAEAIAGAGALPVLVDVDPSTRCMDPARLEGALSDDLVAVVPVHLYGRVAPMAEINRICRTAGVKVLEDAAQAHGAKYGGRRAGAWGDAAAFSFYPTKNLGAFGDAGALVCREETTAVKVRSLRHHGCAPEDPNRHLWVGSSARMDNLQAAVLALRLEHLDSENQQRREVAARYRALLDHLPATLPPTDRGEARQVFHLFVVEVEDRDRVREVMRSNGVGTGVHYPTPIHLQPAWRHLGYAPGDFPVAERLAATCLSLPCFPGITEEEQVRVATALEAAVRET